MKTKKHKKTRGKRVLILIVLLIITVFGIITLTNNKKNNSKEPLTQISSKETKNSENKSTTDNDEIKKVENNKSELEERLTSGKYLSDDGLPVLMYHFFYDKNERNGADGNWIEISDFEEQMKYLSENNYYFPTWEEVESYIDGKTELPEKSVVITVDDGDPSFFKLAVPIIQKYNVKATSFVITYWYGNVAENKEKNISYQSHSNDMHKAGANGKGVMLSWNYNDIKEDLLLSKEILGDATIFCYPFGQYIESNIQVLKDSGFKLAFTTKGGRVKKGASKFELPRVRISGNTSIEAFKSKVK